MRATPPSRRMSDGHPLERHHRRRARVLGDLRLLGRDDVHDDAAAQHLGEPALDTCGASRAFSSHAPESTDAVRRARLRFATAVTVDRVATCRGARPRSGPGVRRIALPVAFEQLRGLRLVGPRPRALDLLAAGEHQQLPVPVSSASAPARRSAPPTYCTNITTTFFGREPHAVGVDVGRAELRAQPRAARRVPRPRDREAGRGTRRRTDAAGRPADRRARLAVREQRRRRDRLAAAPAVHLVDVRLQVVRRVLRADVVAEHHRPGTRLVELLHRRGVDARRSRTRAPPE